MEMERHEVTVTCMGTLLPGRCAEFTVLLLGLCAAMPKFFFGKQLVSLCIIPHHDTSPPHEQLSTLHLEHQIFLVGLLSTYLWHHKFKVRPNIVLIFQQELTTRSRVPFSHSLCPNKGNHGYSSVFYLFKIRTLLS